MAFVYVFIGGGVGSIFRYGISRLLVTADFNFPLATLLANAISCIVLGFLMSMGFESRLSPEYRLLFLTGFCGGFSTFSTFSGETLTLYSDGNTAYALLNIGLNVIICLICIYIGMRLGR